MCTPYAPPLLTRRNKIRTRDVEVCVPWRDVSAQRASCCHESLMESLGGFHDVRMLRAIRPTVGLRIDHRALRRGGRHASASGASRPQHHTPPAPSRNGAEESCSSLHGQPPIKPRTKSHAPWTRRPLPSLPSAIPIVPAPILRTSSGASPKSRVPTPHSSTRTASPPRVFNTPCPNWRGGSPCHGCSRGLRSSSLP